jgi:hypothetical protein
MDGPKVVLSLFLILWMSGQGTEHRSCSVDWGPGLGLRFVALRDVGGPCDDSSPDSCEQEAMSVIDEYGFERLDVEIEGLTHEYEIRWKLLSGTDGPPGYPEEPYIPLAVSFATTSGERRRQGHLDYPLRRSYWAEQRPPVPTEEEDGETLLRLVGERLLTI